MKHLSGPAVPIQRTNEPIKINNTLLDTVVAGMEPSEVRGRRTPNSFMRVPNMSKAKVFDLLMLLLLFSEAS